MAKRYVPYLLGIILFTIYLFTTAPTVYLGDSGELTAAAFSLGIPHNSGYPLYSMLGKLFSLTPLGNIGVRLNLMSVFFSVTTVVIVYGIILRMTASFLAAIVGSTLLAFAPLFWSQTVSAEVYPLHTFFVALMLRVLLWWDENKTFKRLALFVFITGLSFGNHMQTVMLAPAVLFLIISGDKKVLFSAKRLTAISLLFLLALSLYLYLPIRTNADAAIHWGDPNTLERFWGHVTAQSHRGAYVFSAGFSDYVARSIQFIRLIWEQYGIVMLISLWGWWTCRSLRWKLFWPLIIVFDYTYTVFLNIISLQITPFGLSTLIVLAILFGKGLYAFFNWLKEQHKVGIYTRRAAQAGFLIIPLIAFVLNVDRCDQSRNYTAYEHAVNIFRTAESGSTIFLDSDNNVFPVTYGRIVEGMGQGIMLHDRHNVIFRWVLDKHPFVFKGSWKELEARVQEKIIKSGNRNVYFAILEPNAITPPGGYHLTHHGVLRKAVSDKQPTAQSGVWEYYATESLRENFYRDYMNREVAGRYFYWRGENLWQAGKKRQALRQFRMASKFAYDDTTLHSDLGVWFADKGLFEKARHELEKALVYNEGMSGAQNNWGYYYHKMGDFENAIKSFRKAVQLDPKNYTYHNNLAFTLHRIGNKKEALSVFKRSLQIEEDQSKTKEFLRKHWNKEKWEDFLAIDCGIGSEDKSSQ